MVVRALLIAAVLAALPARAQQAAPDLDELAAEALRLLNASRIEAGLDRLRLDPTLALIAYHHSREQAGRRRVSHHSSEFGLSTERRVRISFPKLPRLAENVGRNRTLERLHEALLASEGHRRNRLDPAFTDVGIGLAWDGSYSLYLTEVFATSTDGGPLGTPMAYYFDASPGAYERRDDPRVELGAQSITIGSPGADDPEYWTDRGIDDYYAGDLSGAETAFRKALELKADYHYAEYNLARVLIASGSPREAADLLDGLIELDPVDLDAIATRGTASMFLENYAEAADFFRRVLRRRARDAGTWYNLGLSLEFLDRLADAETAYREALDIDPDLTAAHIGLARVIRRPTHWQAALLLLEFFDGTS
jgi:uncharacterized protein YkwD/Tfp pilus assembly protein PilF